MQSELNQLLVLAITVRGLEIIVSQKFPINFTVVLNNNVISQYFSDCVWTSRTLASTVRCLSVCLLVCWMSSSASIADGHKRLILLLHSILLIQYASVQHRGHGSVRSTTWLYLYSYSNKLKILSLKLITIIPKLRNDNMIDILTSVPRVVFQIIITFRKIARVSVSVQN